MGEAGVQRLVPRGRGCRCRRCTRRRRDDGSRQRYSPLRPLSPSDPAGDDFNHAAHPVNVPLSLTFDKLPLTKTVRLNALTTT